MIISRRLLSKFSLSYYKEPLNLSTTQNSFKHSDLTIQKTNQFAEMPPTTSKDLVFGSVNTDHMLTIDWTLNGGWEKPKIVPFEHFSIHPFASSLHYGLQCYEGLKAYKDQNGKIRLFRPECNMHRFKISSQSLCLPDFDGQQLLKCIKDLVRLDERWIPSKRGFGLYVRPFHIATEPTLGVKEPRSTRIATVLNPVGPYYQSGFQPIKLLTETQKIRSAPGGYGSFKVGGNYGPTIKPAREAKKEGYSQCLFLFDNQVVQVGSSNIFFVLKGQDGAKQLHTPFLDDELILPGITRDSVIELTKQKKGHRVIERKIMIDEIIQAFEQNRVLQIFATGTAVVISPVKELHYNGKSYQVPIDPVKKAGDLSYELFNEMLDIQNGKKPHKWCVELN